MIVRDTLLISCLSTHSPDMLGTRPGVDGMLSRVSGETTLMVTYLNVDQTVVAPLVARRRPGFLGRDSHVAYSCNAPAFFLLLVLVGYSFVLSVWLSLSDARIGNAGSFGGLANFSHLLPS